jgi:hypothetical protein
MAVAIAEAGSMPVFQGRGATRAAAATALVGWVGVGVGHAVARVETHFAYLTAFAFVVSLALGALIFLMTTYVVGARWNTVIRRLNECVVSALPVLALCFLPILFWLGDLYLWTAEPAALPQLSEHEAHALAHKQAYLNVPFFAVRAALYFVIWGAAALVLCRRSARRDRAAPAADEASPHGPERAFSAALLPLVCLALTFAAFDWLMSLQPFWMSSIFGVYVFAGGFVASLAFFILLPRAIKFRGSALAWVGAGLVFGHYLDIYWLVMPMLEGRGPLPSPWDVFALLALGGTFSLAAAGWLSGKSLVAAGDPLLEDSIAYRSPL